jgi:2'-5' RNA ligase
MRIPNPQPYEACLSVVLEVPRRYAKTLADIRADAGDADSGVAPHITLVGPGIVPLLTIDEVGAHVSSVAATTAPFEITLQGVDTFRPVTDVVFVSLTSGAAECAALEARLRSGPFRVPAEFDYHPHVTIAADLPDEKLDAAAAAAASFTATFTACELAVFDYRQQRGWVKVGVLPLGTPVTPSM